MLSLVAYQSSDESDAEDIADSKTLQSESNKDGSCVKNSNSSLLASVLTKTKEAVKISVPSLKEFEDDEKDEPSNKKLKKSCGTGLMSLLPPPKYSKPVASQKSFMPYVLTKKQVPSSTSTGNSSHSTKPVDLSEKPGFVSKPLVETVQNLKKEPASIEENDHTPVTDFFSLEEPKSSFSTSLKNKLESLIGNSEVSGGNVPQNNNEREASPVSSENKSTTSLSDQDDNPHVQYAEATSSAQNYYIGPYVGNESSISSSCDGYPETNPDTTEPVIDEGLLKLQGKKRKGQEEISFIDVSVDDQLSDKTQWLTKSITEELVHRPSRRKNDMPTQLQKRKHQITYLAFQAKERELELKNQWSQNRLTKRETQAKYGF